MKIKFKDTSMRAALTAATTVFSVGMTLVANSANAGT